MQTKKNESERPLALSKKQERFQRAPWAALVGASAALSLFACASSTTTRMVDDPSGQSVKYGAPRERSFHAEMDAALESAQVTVYESSVCDVIPVTVLQRYQETLRGDEVIQRTPVTKKQSAGQPEKQISCNQTYARNIEVLLEAGDARWSLGKTDGQGRVSANLFELMQVQSFNDVPEQATVLIRPDRAQPLTSAGVVKLSELQRRENRVRELLEELKEILAQEEQNVPRQDLTRAYELYSQLQELAGEDARVKGVSLRFWEFMYGRRLEEQRMRMERNLESLDKAKDLLKQMDLAAIPFYLQAAVNSGQMDARSLEWASLRLIRAIRGTPQLCAAGGFSWGQVASYGWPQDAMLASEYVRYGYGDGHASLLNQVCRF